MIRPCTPEAMKERIAASSRQTVRVQKVRSRSRNTETERLAVARVAWRAARTDWIRKPGRYRHKRTRSRVTETKGISVVAAQQSFAQGVFDQNELDLGRHCLAVGGSDRYREAGQVLGAPVLGMILTSSGAYCFKVSTASSTCSSLDAWTQTSVSPLRT